MKTEINLVLPSSFKSEENTNEIDKEISELLNFKDSEFSDFMNAYSIALHQLNDYAKKEDMKYNMQFCNNLALYSCLILYTNFTRTTESFKMNFKTHFNNVSDIVSSTTNIIKHNLSRFEKIKSFNNSYSIIYTSLEKQTKEYLTSYNSSNLDVINFQRNKSIFVYPSLEFKVLSNDLELDKDKINSKTSIDISSAFISSENKINSYNDEKIAGNKTAIKTLRIMADLLLCYDIKTKKNPTLDYLDVPKIVTMIGPAGTGKTMMINHIIKYLFSKSRELNKAFSFVPIDGTIKSEYHGVSQRNLKERFDIMYRGEQIYLMSLEEIDTKVFSRNMGSLSSSSELSFTGTFLECINGINNYLGNFMLLVTSNRNLNTDSGLKSRLMENVVYVKGLESRQDYITVFNNKLKKLDALEKVNVSDWNEIAQTCVIQNFQGRDIANICKQIYLNTLNQLDTSLLHKKINSVQEVLKENISNITDDTIMNVIEKYSKNSNIMSEDYLI